MTSPKPALKKSDLTLDGAEIASLLVTIVNAFAGTKDVTLYIHVIYDDATMLIELNLQRDQFTMVASKDNYTAPTVMDMSNLMPMLEKMNKNPATKKEAITPPQKLPQYLKNVLLPELDESLSDVTSVKYYVRAA